MFSKGVPQTYLNRLTRERMSGMLILSGVAWLLLISRLMIADVWDETNGFLLLATEPMAGAGALQSLKMIWLHELPLDIYRPLGSSLFIVLAQLTDGNFVILRYANALLILAAVSLMTSVLSAQRDLSPHRTLTFFVISLFSAAAMISSGWFANVFDASCLFFIALAFKLFYGRHLVAGAVAFSLAAFCKEAYVLAFPLFGLMLYEFPREQRKQLLLPVLIVTASSLFYWSVRHALVPVGSEGDIHGFAPNLYLDSTLSFAGGFLFQFSKFTPGHPLLWLGISGLLLSLAALRNPAALITAIVMLLSATVVYWGMFGYQGERLMSAAVFVARLYLIPFITFLYLLCRYGDRRVLPVVALFSLWGMLATFSDYRGFQQTYKAIYELAEQSEQPLQVHYPEKPLEDFRRGLSIGNFPGAALRIDVLNGGLE